jgi:hypothetical protein
LQFNSNVEITTLGIFIATCNNSYSLTHSESKLNAG